MNVVNKLENVNWNSFFVIVVVEKGYKVFQIPTLALQIETNIYLKTETL